VKSYIADSKQNKTQAAANMESSKQNEDRTTASRSNSSATHPSFTYQEMANNSPKVRQLKFLQEIANHRQGDINDHINPIQLVVNAKYINNLIYTEEQETLSGRDLSEETSLDVATHSIQHGNGIAYIINSIVSYTGLKDLQQVINAMIKGLDIEDHERIALIIGVNANENEKEKMLLAIQSAEEIISSYNFAIALVPMTFTGKKFPYGQMRNQVLQSAETKNMTEYFTHLKLHPYISIQDFDTGSRSVGDNEGAHIFHAIDDLLGPEPEEEGYDDNVEMFDEEEMQDEESYLPSGLDDSKDNKHKINYLPLMIAGGYRVGNKEDLIKRLKAKKVKSMSKWTDLEFAQYADKFIDKIAKDMEYRQQYAELDPMIPYAPEPNLFLDATAVMKGSPNGRRLEFSAGAAEFTGLAKNVHRFAADELETHYSKKYNSAISGLPEVGYAEAAKGILEETRNELTSVSQNNRHPVRESSVMVDYEGLNVETDLSRLATASSSVMPQSHTGLTVVADRIFNSKPDKKGVSTSLARKGFLANLIKTPINANNLLDQKWTTGRVGNGGKMSEAISTPFSPTGYFTDMSHGVQPGYKTAMLHQIAIEQKRREYFDTQFRNHHALVENFKVQSFPFHETPARLMVSNWTNADGDCGIYSLGIIIGDHTLTRANLVLRLNRLGTSASIAAAAGISGSNFSLWLSNDQLINIGSILGFPDIAVVTFNLLTNNWALLNGNPLTSAHIIGAVPASLNGNINHWVVLRRI